MNEQANGSIETAPTAPLPPQAAVNAPAAPEWADAGLPPVPERSHNPMPTGAKVALAIGALALVAMVSFGAGWSSRGVLSRFTGAHMARAQQFSPDEFGARDSQTYDGNSFRGYGRGQEMPQGQPQRQPEACPGYPDGPSGWNQ